MNVAVCSHEKRDLALVKKFNAKCRNLGYLIHGTYFSEEIMMIEALRKRRFETVFIHKACFETIENEAMKEITELCKDALLLVVCGDMRAFLGLTSTKYTASFNGQDHILDLQDIDWIESYYRKTSVVAGKNKFRIRARLDEEEQRLQKLCFYRINRYTLVNFGHVNFVEGKFLHMENGEVLEVGSNRLKDFQEHYGEYIKRRFVIL